MCEYEGGPVPELEHGRHLCFHSCVMSLEKHWDVRKQHCHAALSVDLFV